MSGAFGMGSSSSSNQATGMTQSQGMSQSNATSDQSVAFGDLYSKLFKGAASSASDAMVSAPDITSAAKSLFSGGSQFLNSMTNNAGTQYQDNRLNSTDPTLQANIDQLRTETGRLFTEQLNPAITSQAVGDGTLGGGRQGVAQGAAIDNLGRQFTAGVTQLQSNSQAQKDQIAQSVAGNSVASASTGLGALPSMLDLLTQGDQSGLGIYAKLSSIMGGPTTLTSSQSNAQSIANSFGTTQSSGEGKAWNFNMSGGMFGS